MKEKLLHKGLNLVVETKQLDSFRTRLAKTLENI